VESGSGFSGILHSIISQRNYGILCYTAAETWKLTTRGGYLYLQITLFTGIDCFKIILMMCAGIDNILCDHNHSHSIIYVVMNLSASLKYFNKSVDMSCPIIAVKQHVTVGYGRMFSAKLLKGYHLTSFLIF
jgi:hypothetical protein